MLLPLLFMYIACPVPNDSIVIGVLGSDQSYAIYQYATRDEELEVQKAEFRAGVYDYKINREIPLSAGMQDMLFQPVCD
jgi:hypothetical protein